VAMCEYDLRDECEYDLRDECGNVRSFASSRM